MIHICFAGIDLGSTMTKAVIIDSDDEICASVIEHTGAEHNVGLIKRIEDLGIRVLIPSHPQIVNALGAAIIARNS